MSSNITMEEFHKFLNSHIDYRANAEKNGLVTLNKAVSEAVQKVFSQNTQKMWLKEPKASKAFGIIGGVIVQSKEDWETKKTSGDYFPISLEEGYQQNGKIVSGDTKVSDATQNLYDKIIAAEKGLSPVRSRSNTPVAENERMKLITEINDKQKELQTIKKTISEENRKKPDIRKKIETLGKELQRLEKLLKEMDDKHPFQHRNDDHLFPFKDSHSESSDDQYL